ncbi:MAG: hypothetical protein JWQ69_5938 [Pseudomonas sp.]|nr:hypothetical protein [Pseudomonas sp.]
MTFSSSNYAGKCKYTPSESFLTEIEQSFALERFTALIGPYFQGGQRSTISPVPAYGERLQWVQAAYKHILDFEVRAPACILRVLGSSAELRFAQKRDFAAGVSHHCVSTAFLRSLGLELPFLISRNGQFRPSV